MKYLLYYQPFDTYILESLPAQYRIAVATTKSCNGVYDPALMTVN